MNITRYLDRIGYDGLLKPGFQTLATLQKKHIERVPFETFDLFLNKLFTLKFENLYEKIVTKGRGGYCYEQNGLFYWVLKTLGYKATMLCGRFLSNLESKHMVLLIDLDQQWLVDVGWGNGFYQPISLNDCEKTEKGIVVKEGNASYLLSLDPATLSDFEERNQFHQKSAASPFQKEPICLLPGKELKGNRFEHNGETLEIPDEQSYAKILASQFGIQIDEVASALLYNKG